jgi:hypothetical protein
LYGEAARIIHETGGDINYNPALEKSPLVFDAY